MNTVWIVVFAVTEMFLITVVICLLVRIYRLKSVHRKDEEEKLYLEKLAEERQKLLHLEEGKVVVLYLAGQYFSAIGDKKRQLKEEIYWQIINYSSSYGVDVFRAMMSTLQSCLPDVAAGYDVFSKKYLARLQPQPKTTITGSHNRFLVENAYLPKAETGT